jgi:adenylate kinase
MFSATGREPLRVISIEVPFDEIRRRLSGRRWCSLCNGTFHVTDNPPRPGYTPGGEVSACLHQLEVRSDDKPEAVEKRLQAYSQQTAPLMDYYQRRGVLKAVVGLGPIAEIFAALQASLAA